MAAEMLMKRIFLAYFAWNKKMEKFWILDHNHLTSCFYTLKRRFSFLECRETYFPAYFLSNKKMEKISNF